MNALHTRVWDALGTVLDPEIDVLAGVKVVLVAKPLPWPKTQILQAHRAGVVAEPGCTHGVPAVFGAVNVEPVEVLTAPAEYRLQLSCSLTNRTRTPRVVSSRTSRRRGTVALRGRERSPCTRAAKWSLNRPQKLQQIRHL